MLLGLRNTKGPLLLFREPLVLKWRRTRDSNSQARKGSGFQDRRITIILVLQKFTGIKICLKFAICNKTIQYDYNFLKIGIFFLRHYSKCFIKSLVCNPSRRSLIPEALGGI
jgi:hypothetical protein